jgi:hypothetical protein
MMVSIAPVLRLEAYADDFYLIAKVIAVGTNNLVEVVLSAAARWNVVP